MAKRTVHLWVVVGVDVLYALDKHVMRFAPRLAATDRYLDILSSAVTDDIRREAAR